MQTDGTGQIWYEVGKDQWIQVGTVPTTTNNNNPSTSTSSAPLTANGVVTIASSGINLRSDPETGTILKALPGGSR